MKLKELSKQEILEYIIYNAIAHEEYSQKGDYRNANLHYKNLMQIKNYLVKNNLIDILQPLLNHYSAPVRNFAARYLICLTKYEAISKNILKEVKKMNIKGASFNADMILKEWEAGNLTLEN